MTSDTIIRQLGGDCERLVCVKPNITFANTDFFAYNEIYFFSQGKLLIENCQFASGTKIELVAKETMILHNAWFDYEFKEGELILQAEKITFDSTIIPPTAKKISIVTDTIYTRREYSKNFPFFKYWIPLTKK